MNEAFQPIEEAGDSNYYNEALQNELSEDYGEDFYERMNNQRREDQTPVEPGSPGLDQPSDRDKSQRKDSQGEASPAAEEMSEENVEPSEPEDLEPKEEEKSKPDPIGEPETPGEKSKEDVEEPKPEEKPPGEEVSIDNHVPVDLNENSDSRSLIGEEITGTKRDLGLNSDEEYDEDGYIIKKRKFIYREVIEALVAEVEIFDTQTLHWRKVIEPEADKRTSKDIIVQVLKIEVQEVSIRKAIKPMVIEKRNPDEQIYHRFSNYVIRNKPIPPCVLKREEGYILFKDLKKSRVKTKEKKQKEDERLLIKALKDDEVRNIQILIDKDGREIQLENNENLFSEDDDQSSEGRVRKQDRKKAKFGAHKVFKNKTVSDRVKATLAIGLYDEGEEAEGTGKKGFGEVEQKERDEAGQPSYRCGEHEGNREEAASDTRHQPETEKK